MGSPTEYLPPGISEAEFVEIVNQVSGNPSYKFVFGYNNIEDMKQQALLISINLMGHKINISDSTIPTKGINSIFLTTLNNKLHIRIFNIDREMIVDTNEDEITKKYLLEELKEELLNNNINWYDRSRILNIIVNLFKYKPAGCKFKPRGEKPMRQQLANFLRVWIYNRLSNYRRDNCCKYPNNGGANQVKFNLNYCLPIYSLGLATSEMFAVDSELPESASQNEITNRILSKLRKPTRGLYDKYMNEEKLSDDEFKRLKRAIKRVLNGNPEDYL